MINIDKRSKNRPNLQVGIKKITLRLRIFEKFVFCILQIFQKSGVQIIHPVPSLKAGPVFIDCLLLNSIK
jgi:hypothetical protein